MIRILSRRLFFVWFGLVVSSSVAMAQQTDSLLQVSQQHNHELADELQGTTKKPHKKSRKKLWEILQTADSLRLQLRQSADRGVMLQWSDSILMSELDKSRLSDRKKERIMKRYGKIQKNLSLYDRRLSWGDSLLAAKYNRKTFDTTYISRPDARWTVKLRCNVSGAFMQTLSRVEDVTHETQLMADCRSTFSVAVSYRGVGLGLSVNPAKWVGKSHDYEFNLNSYSNRYGFDVVYLSSKTYQGHTKVGDDRIDIPKGLVSQKALNLNFYYAFNYRKFSFPAAFSQSYIQKRSAGSWMVGASFDGSKTEVSSDEENSSLRPITIRLNEFAIGGGYAYNIVPNNHWLFHISALPTLTVYSHDYTKTESQTVDENGEVETSTTRNSMKYHFPSAIITGRGAILYSWRNKFAGATMVYNFSVAGSEAHLRLKRVKWMVRMFFGFRF